VNAFWQRGWNRQPGLGSITFGGSPRSPVAAARASWLRAARRLVHSGEQPGHSRLAAAALPGERDDLPLADAEGHVVDGCLAEAAAMAWTQLIASLP
jgi:hypothetical protein